MLLKRIKIKNRKSKHIENHVRVLFLLILNLTNHELAQKTLEIEKRKVRKDYGRKKQSISKVRVTP